MGKQKVTFDEPTLNEVFYSAIMGMSLEEKKSLPDRLKKKVKNQSSAEKFSKSSSLDDKREFLSYIGISTFLMILPEGNFSIRKFDEVYKDYKSNNVIEGIRTASKTGIFVSSDRELCFYMGKMSQSFPQSPYTKNLELKNAGSIFRKWKTKITDSDPRYEEDSKSVVKIILSSLSSFNNAESDIGVTQEQLLVLLFFYSNRGMIITKETLQGHFQSEMASAKIRSIVKYLCDNLLIQKSFEVGANNYYITKLGIRRSQQFRDMVLKSSKF